MKRNSVATASLLLSVLFALVACGPDAALDTKPVKASVPAHREYGGLLLSIAGTFPLGNADTHEVNDAWREVEFEAHYTVTDNGTTQRPRFLGSAFVVPGIGPTSLQEVRAPAGALVTLTVTARRASDTQGRFSGVVVQQPVTADVTRPCVVRATLSEAGAPPSLTNECAVGVTP